MQPERPRQRAELARSLADQVSDHHRAERGAIILIHGEAGIGKTTLAESLAASSSSGGHPVWVARAAELSQSTPYALLDGAVTVPDRLPLFDAPLFQTQPLVIGHGLPKPEVERFGVVEAVLDVVEAQSQEPALIIFEDVHWADGASLDALSRIARAALTHPLVLVMTYRDGGEANRLDELLTDLVDIGAENIAIGPLDAGEIAALVDRLCGGHASDSLRRRAEGAGGNPFLVHELVNGLLAEGRLLLGASDLDPLDGDVPQRLQHAVGRELTRLGEVVGAVVRAASVQGNDIDVRDLAAVLERSPVALTTPIEAAVRAGLFTGDAGVLRFRHDLVRDAVYQQMPAVIRNVTHRDLASVLTARGAPAALVASHLLLADGHEHDIVEQLQAAARQTAPLAPESALAFLDRARELVDDDLAIRRLIEEARLEALTAAGRLGEAASIAHWLLAASSEAARSRLQARLSGLALIEGDGRRSLAFAHEAIASAHSDADRSRYLAVAAVTSATNRQYADAFGLANEARELGRACDDPVSQSMALALLARISTYGNKVHEGLQLGAEAIALADVDETGEAHAWIPCLHYGMTAFDVDDLNTAEAIVARGNELAISHRMAWALPLYGTLGAACHLRRGELDQAAAEAESVVELAHRMRSRQSLSWAQAMLALVHLEIGTVAESRAWIDDAVATWATGQSSLGVNYLALAKSNVLAAEGDPEQAFRSLCADWDALANEGLTFCHPLLNCELAGLARLIGDVDRERAAIASTEAAAEANGVLAVRAQAQWLRAISNHDSASARSALGQLRLTERRLDVARWLAAEPELVAGDGDPIAPRREALVLFDALGALSSAAEMRTELDRLGETPSSASSSWDALTPTELDILRLLAQGRTNAEMAQERRSSRRTIESHLRRAYQKLGIEGRSRLTVEATKRFRVVNS